MNDEERILELIKTNGGLIKTSDVTSKNINKMALVRLMKKGLIDRIERGLYIVYILILQKLKIHIMYFNINVLKQSFLTKLHYIFMI